MHCYPTCPLKDIHEIEDSSEECHVEKQNETNDEYLHLMVYVVAAVVVVEEEVDRNRSLVGVALAVSAVDRAVMMDHYSLFDSVALTWENWQQTENHR